MSLIPAFAIGVWNGWIFSAYLLLSFIIFTYITTKKKSPSFGEGRISKSSMLFANSSKLVLIPAMIYSIFLPMKLGTMWFFIGLPITLVGLITYTIVLINWANTSVDTQVSKGLYRFSRHPMYVTTFVYLIGLSILTASWIFLLVTAIFSIGCLIFVSVEEESCLKKYGNSYWEYMNKTPKWVGIPKSDIPQ